MLALLSLFLFSAFAYKEQILRCRYEDGSHIHRLQDLYVDVQAVLADQAVDVRVQRPSDLEHIQRYLSACTVTVEDLEKETLEVEKLNNLARQLPIQIPDDWFKSYHTYEEVSQWYQQLSIDYPTLVRWNPVVATTQEGRSVFAISIFNYGNGPVPRVPTYTSFHTGGIHAREWISPATLQYVTWQLINEYNTNTSDQITRDWVNTVETHVLGIINPDGYAYTWVNASTRQWRKNRNTNTPGTCVGVDQNRNFPDHWGQGGSSTDPCSDTYMGVSANSENETRGITAYFQSVAATARVIFAIDWHSYSQLFLRPYGWTNNVSPDEQRFIQLGNDWVKTVQSVHGKVYTSQRSYQLYQTTGSASDWYYGASNPAGVRRTAAWTIELRPTGAPGFILPPAEIIPTGEENWAGFRGLIQSLLAEPLP